MTTCLVSELLGNDPTKLSYTDRVILKAKGRDTPIFTFNGKRQCRLSEHYDKHKWLCGSTEKKALFCFPCLMFNQVSRDCFYFNYNVFIAGGVIIIT